jgi:dTDP-4-dehydrorhamnose reductase
VTAVGREELDLAGQSAVRCYLRELRPEIIVNAAAYTDVDGAESNRELAYSVNGDGPRALAEELHHYGGRGLVHFSTDYVFDGSSNVPYREDDPPGPVNVYGESKLAGEQAIASSGAPYVILRSSWVYSALGRNFLLTLLRLAHESKPLRVVSDQSGVPNWTRPLAEATAEVVKQILRMTPPEVARASGIYHIAAAGQATWHGFAEAILQECLDCLRNHGRNPDWCEQALARLQPIPTSEYPTRARRPSYSVLSTDKIAKVFGIRLGHWREQLRAALEGCSLCEVLGPPK